MSQHYQQRKAANERYLATQDRLTIRIPKGSDLKTAIKAHAAAREESVQAFIVRAINQTMEKDNRGSGIMNIEYLGMLSHYKEDLPDDALLDEAIATLENFFCYMDKDVLLHRSRPLAIAYLALKHEQVKREAPSR